MDTTPRPASPVPSTDVPSPPSRLLTGRSGEDLAADHLVQSGMVVLARNWRIVDGELRGELDLVAMDGDALVVVEVKARRGTRFGQPVEAVGMRKQARLRALASAFLRETGIRCASVRFDVIGVVLTRDETTVTHLRAAF